MDLSSLENFEMDFSKWMLLLTSQPYRSQPHMKTFLVGESQNIQDQLFRINRPQRVVRIAQDNAGDLFPSLHRQLESDLHFSDGQFEWLRRSTV